MSSLNKYEPILGSMTKGLVIGNYYFNALLPFFCGSSDESGFPFSAQSAKKSQQII